MISQHEADELLAMKKIVIAPKSMHLPKRGDKTSWDLESNDGSERFIIDVWRGKIEIARYSVNHRFRKSFVLARVCVNNAPHMNPDGELLSGPHLHLYQEGLGDAYAIPLPKEFFSSPDDIVCTVREFLKYCNVVEHPKVHLQEAFF